MEPSPAGFWAKRVAAADSELYRRLQLSLILRVIMVTFLLGTTFFIQFSKHSSLDDQALFPLYLLSGATYFVTLVSIFALRWLKRLRPFAFAQIAWEIVFVTALIYDTSGPYESIFSFLYLIAIIMAGILQYRAGAFSSALLGSLGYAIIMIGLEAQYIPRWPSLIYYPIGWNRLVYNIFINIAAMFGMAVLSSYLTEKLRMTGNELQQTQRHRDVLEALNDIVVRSIPSGLITLDREGKITSLNRAAEKITGLAAARAQGNNLTKIWPASAELLAPSPELVPAGVSRYETSWKTPAGETRNLEFIVSPMNKTDGEPLGALVVANDITEIRRMEKKLRQADRLATVGQLAAGIAHEIRNPLASISGSIQVLESDLQLDPPSQRLMKIVLRETQRLNALITDFLLYARPEPKSIQTVPLDQLIPDVVVVFKNRTDITAKLIWNIEIQPGLTVSTDPKLIEQIFWNLLNNSVQAVSGEGTISIRAADAPPGPATEPRADPALVQLEIEDNGVGISPELRDRIFDPFFTTREGGTGLGLSTVYRIVEALDGSITVEDAQPSGARFVIKIPKSSAVPAPAGAPEP